MLNIGIIGCGLIGQKRAKSLGEGSRLVACADIDLNRAQSLAGTQSKAFDNYHDLLALPEVDAVVVSTLHDSLAAITLAAIQSGKHVLVEKPAARHTRELEPVMAAANQIDVKVRVGFNHRYHRAMRKAKQLVDDGVLGDLMFIRARYGHGGRVGYDKEWRSRPELSGGGELIDQGPHLIDLSRWFLSQEFVEVQGFAHTYYWDMPVDDNGFMLLKTANHQTAFLHASCTEWKNLFSMEIYGRDGKLEISGLGGSYGVERLTWYKMLPEMGPPETTTWEYPMTDNSWAIELAEFYDDILLNRSVDAGLQDAYESLKVIQHIYRISNYDF
ncbi:Gfo/Idh/MocA family protein [Cylindrospermopsis raciborskii]|jgi:predicted dehydrogenase|uniref:Gfo/Idh/MocA family protein n=1 Tax=Cylindrospermopsis raciborskii TaxID=77022 RepID=UPI000E1F5178|nr:Gfo/Idh/MocA family oxidoreductase [Cylindrospermopsis raciborskii]UJL34047.1 Gfo/Idh/MocA family oxidoreductase [Cylindrospermopsis raciborskii Cr2010]